MRILLDFPAASGGSGGTVPTVAKKSALKHALTLAGRQGGGASHTHKKRHHRHHERARHHKHHKRTRRA